MENKKLVLDIKIKIALLYPFAFLLTLAILLFPAGTWKYWHAWLLCIVLYPPAMYMSFYFLKRNPEFLERRMKYKEKEMKQKKIISFTSILFLIAFLLPGFDYRYDWSKMPIWLVIAGAVVFLISFYIVFLAFKENAYAGRTVEVFEGHKVIDTGPYSIVRHPMYVGVIPMFISFALILGSYVAIIPLILISVSIIPRILNEEKVLLEDLAGYKAYCEKIKYRLLPYIW